MTVVPYFDILPLNVLFLLLCRPMPITSLTESESFFCSVYYVSQCFSRFIKSSFRQRRKENLWWSSVLVPNMLVTPHKEAWTYLSSVAVFGLVCQGSWQKDCGSLSPLPALELMNIWKPSERSDTLNPFNREVLFNQQALMHLEWCCRGCAGGQTDRRTDRQTDRGILTSTIGISSGPGPGWFGPLANIRLGCSIHWFWFWCRWLCCFFICFLEERWI